MLIDIVEFQPKKNMSLSLIESIKILIQTEAIVQTLHHK